MLSEYWVASYVGEGDSLVCVQLEYLGKEVLDLLCAVCFDAFLSLLDRFGVAEGRCEFL